MSLGGRLAALLVEVIACSDPASTPTDAAIPVDMTTSLVVKFGSVQRTLDRAYFGVTRTASGATLRLEAYRGGGSGCPTQSSPTTDYTLVLAKVPLPSGMTPVTSPGNILDFVGDLLDGQLGAAATAVTITPIATDVCATCNETYLSADTSMTFAGGTIMGHLFATHCDSLDEQL